MYVTLYLHLLNIILFSYRGHTGSRDTRNTKKKQKFFFFHTRQTNYIQNQTLTGHDKGIKNTTFQIKIAIRRF